jgi:uncharacterized metal-binding protein
MMDRPNENFTLNVTGTKTVCAVGEIAGKQCIEARRIPVISCEGACIRGEIARLAAHLVSKEDPFSRSCHGEMFTAPESAMARWMKEAEYTVVIDGCFMKCHGRILEHLIGGDKVAQFDALSIYKKYTDLINIDDVPEAERRSTARQVADRVLEKLRSGMKQAKEEQGTCG